ncbi:ATP-binding protein [Poseidonibacter lekithochrous]|uniref:AAA family ATPase n=1 Tax=Poseidonibacter TaxID=2321187 RepID=UPI001C094B17|nr:MULTISPECIES: AAA family ATPase [Poseidonibacter]MBU3014426.1 ATP-binding protein [Poseidonibacter lekithochrous]MDO6827724.1 AAA family ATPase [Poseidonibacter sp. 1_MG-2023]
MELVYLWVEDYKNIKKQGFNFSPRFECEFFPIYEEDEYVGIKISDKSQLLVKENNHINIFEDNINITAIVGENGSGKSSILEYLLSNKTNSNIKLSQDFDDGLYNILWVYDNKLKKIVKLNYQNLVDTEIILHNEDIDSVLHNNSYNTNKYLEKSFGTENRSDINNIIISYFSHAENLQYLTDLNFLPTHIELNLLSSLNEFKNLYGLEIRIDNYFDSHDIIKIHEQEIERFNNFIKKELDSQIYNFNEKGNIKYYLYIREFIHKLSRDDFSSINIFKEIVINNYTERNFINKIENKLFKNENELVFISIIEQFNKINKKKEDDKFIIDLTENDLVVLLKNSNRNFFRIKFFQEINNNNRIYFSDLSSGEQKIIVLFSKLYYLVSRTKKKEILILLDEPDNYLHPNWQRKFINNFLSFIQNTELFNDRIFNIIITSHSPFILSDLLKEHALFLKDGKQKKINLNPFGANIHTLLSHGFFMKDGLMGEFAKDKIDTAIKYLNQTKLSDDEISYCENIISIIGEPIIKRQLQKMLDSKRLKKVDKIDDIEKQILKLSQELKSLKND